MSSDNYQAVLLEDIKSQNIHILEILDSMKTIPIDVAVLKTDLEQVKNDTRVIKAAVRVQQKDLSEVRVLNGLSAHGA